MLDRGIKYFNGIVAEIEAQQGTDKTIPADKVRGGQGETARRWVAGHDNVVLKLVVTRTVVGLTHPVWLCGGRQAFYLYDTLGFPVDLTQLMAAERGFTVDAQGFVREMEEQKARCVRGEGARQLHAR